MSRWLPLAALVLVACRPGPFVPAEPSPAAEPFLRRPYLQAVDSSGAWVLWRGPEGLSDRFRYRVNGGPWQTAPVEVLSRNEDGSLPGRDGADRGEAPLRTGPDEAPLRTGPGEVPPAPAPGRAEAAVADRRVHLTGLPAGGRVEYEVWLDTVTAGPYAFRTAPPAADSGEVRILAFGDSGWGSEAQLRLAQRMEPFQRWDLAVHTGDIAYVEGSEFDFTVRHFRVYRELLARVPFFPSPGNHDLRTEGGRPYDRAFLWPRPRPEARYYTFRWGMVRFFALDTATPEAAEALRRREGAEYAWLRAALDSARSEPGVRWRIAYMHHPVHSHASGFAGKSSDPRLRAALVPLFERYGVDLVLSGHDHHYERSFPLRGREIVPAGCGPVYLVTGGGGASLYARGLAPSPLAARSARDYHYLDLRVGTDGIEGAAVRVDGTLLDEFRVLPFSGSEEVATEEGAGRCR